ncbi:MAG: S49 family peptidase, partial [Armatimonadota bacterium]|nr:S49 family peptidase [Armatimonadota bacterium]
MGLGVLLADLFMNLLRALRNLILGRLPAPSYVVVEVRGPLPERRPRLPSLVRWLRRPPLSLEELREQLDRVASHPRIRGIVLVFRDLSAGWASLESLRRALVRFRGRGKRVCAYLPTATLAEYYVASAADRILAPEGAELWLVGLRREVAFLRAALDRLGILPQFHHTGEYKTALHPLLHEHMPPEQREATTTILLDVLEHICRAIAESRGLAPERVREAIERGLLSAQEAHARNLIDAVAFEDELPLRLEPGHRVRIEPWGRVHRRLPKPYRWRILDRWTVGVVEVTGALVLGESQELPFPI